MANRFSSSVPLSKGTTMSNTQDAVAAFLASGGKVTKVADNARTMSERELYFAVRDPIVSREVSDDVDAAISERQHEIGCAYGTEGVNDFNMGIAKHGKRAMLGWEK